MLILSFQCLATLIPNVPYHRLKPGLLSRIVKQMKPYLHHRDPNIRVACLTCLGSVSSVQAPLLEVCYILQPNRSSHQQQSRVSETESTTTATTTGGIGLDLSASTDNLRKHSPAVSGTTSGIPTPHLSSGCQTPSFSETVAAGDQVLWPVKLCVRNVTPHLLLKTPAGGETGAAVSGVVEGGEMPAAVVAHTRDTQPLPVRLESLQLLAHLAKGYFTLIRSASSLFLSLP